MPGRDIVSKTGNFFSLLFLVICGLCRILHPRADKDVLKTGTCRSFYEYSLVEHGLAATWTLSKDFCYLCNDVNAEKSWLISKFINTNNAELVHMDITVSFTKCSTCANQFLKVFAIQQILPINIGDKKLIPMLNNLTLLKKIKNNETGEKKQETHHVQFSSQSRGMQIVLLVEGACIIVYKLEVSFFFCEKLSKDGVSLPKTLSPASGNRTVNASCFKNTEPSNKNVSGSCGSDGEWKFVTPCLCKEGLTFGNNGCESCQGNRYKTYVGNGPCLPCPSNSKSAAQATRCECKEGFYRFRGELLTAVCHGIPSEVQDLKSHRLTDDSVLITWLPPSRKVNRVFYDIKCFKCQRSGFCEDSCGGKITYRPAESNITQLNVTVEHLEPNSQYKFVIQSKNNNSDQINESNWLSAVEIVETKDFRPSSGLSKLIIIVVPIVVFLIILIVILIVVLLRRRNRRQSGTLLKNGVDLPLMDGEKNYIDPTTYDDPERAVKEFAKELSRDVIKFESVLGGGEFGDVYKGTLKRPGQPVTKVAIKTLKPGSTTKNRKDFLLEASVMGQFKNLNVVTLEGVVTKSIPLLIVTEFMENGSLDSYLKSNDGLLKALQLLGMARGVASGMAYLAGMHFVHRDLAARNVLINVNLACKVADFGLSRDIGECKDSEYETQGGRIPVRWTAPEAIRYRKFSAASDMWSYGILLWEIMSYAERPYWDWGNLEVLERVDSGYRLPPPMNCPKIVHQLMMECWETDRTKRPAFADIVKMLDEWIRSPEKLKEDKIKMRRSEPLDFTTFSSVKEWLDAFKMGMYASNFARAGYRNLDDVVNLSEDELLGKVGVRLIGHRHKIYQQIKEMNEHMKLARDPSVRI